MTSLWVQQHVNVLCHPQVSRMKLARLVPLPVPHHPLMMMSLPVPHHPLMLMSLPVTHHLHLMKMPLTPREGKRHWWRRVVATPPLRRFCRMRSIWEEVSLSLFMEDLGSLAGPSRTSSPRSSISSDSISNPATPSVSISNPPPPSNPSPYARPEASRGPRRSTPRTRGVPELLSVTLTTAQEDQTRLMGAMGQDFTRVADSLGERGHVTDVIQDIAGNTTAIITCLRDLETTTASLVKEVQTLNESVQGHTAAIVGVQTETNNLLRRIAVALEGRPPATVDAPLPDETPPPSTRQLRSRGRGRGRRQAN